MKYSYNFVKNGVYKSILRNFARTSYNVQNFQIPRPRVIGTCDSAWRKRAGIVPWTNIKAHCLCSHKLQRERERERLGNCAQKQSTSSSQSEATLQWPVFFFFPKTSLSLLESPNTSSAQKISVYSNSRQRSLR